MSRVRRRSAGFRRSRAVSPFPPFRIRPFNAVTSTVVSAARACAAVSEKELTWPNFDGQTPDLKFTARPAPAGTSGVKR
jgi:hypothetical protein